MNPKYEREFEFDRKIEPFQLDVEAVRQADLFFKWAERLVDAQFKSEQAEMNLKVVVATMQLRFREDPDKYGLKSVTEKAVESAVLASVKYKSAMKDVIDAKKAMAWLQRAVSAMDQKKRMIECLITLHGQEYFAGPSVPRDLVTAWKEHQKVSEQNVVSKQKGKIRKRVTCE